MKKGLLISLVCILLITGCNEKTNNSGDKDKNITPVVKKLTQEEINLKYDEMKSKLIEYGKLIYENDTWTKGNVQVMTYHMSLKEMQDINKYDISMFINPETGKQCDLEKTKIEFVVKSSTSTKTEYSFNPVVVCE